MFTAPSVPFTATLMGAPDGRAGHLSTVAKMRAMVRECKCDPAIIQKATGIIYMQPQHDEFSEVRALFEFVRDHIRYQMDVVGVETLADPRMTLRRQVGDCDDKATLCASLLESVGYPTRFVMAGYHGPEYEHVYFETLVRGHWVPCETTEMVPLGWSAPDPVCWWIERV